MATQKPDGNDSSGALALLCGVFTVGNQQSYDRGIIEHGREFKKLGRRNTYPGGFAVRTPAEAERLIDESGKRGEWAVYELQAEWDRDTVTSDTGWWHALINDSTVIRRVDT
jgi:hypothetical protein